ncbi:MAG: hydrolase [Frankiales bacterium]|nr:hydrolase [Frankiales bacterium]
MTRPGFAAELDGVTAPDRERWVAALASPDGTERSRPDHVTASGLVLDPTGGHVLLVLHRKVGLWLQPGGHVDPGDTSLAQAARREATEETGLAGLAVDPVPIALDAHPAPCGARTHLDVQFLVRAPGRDDPVVSAESLDVRWWPVAALPQQRIDLRALVAAGLARWSG